ncbi:Indole-3-acetyl-aspartic acid hydrolase [Oceanobacillus picturae]|uniref:Indole-3-acetyl-aspartic acid hydrolase n=1 Tax=Oceanobacillus picturae TaxID=171693 RepID=W9A9J5_9BACI|nr:amidohydrolase [Oceanobacillus picturae]CDO02143.1 Indole-3-acetyl-aspartic acid hydrolase [Oceanobacillus picturae]
MQQLEDKLIQWRRDFHQYPETGFMEMRTASIVASILDKLGFQLKMGKEVMSEADCMGKPTEEETKKHYQWAQKNGAIDDYLNPFSEGYTGIVATLDTGKKGPIIAYRFDMDALDILESDSNEHFPHNEGFSSKVHGKMHACGHDSHTSMGLGLATLLIENKEELKGKIKLIFQPAEEGTRGAKAMAAANIVEDVDYFIATHIGVGVPHKQFVAANSGFLATSKLDITYDGTAAHAGGSPEEGKNALLAAAASVLSLHGISRHSGGATRINVGQLEAGAGRNIIANHASMKVETRGETSEINDYVKEQVTSVVSGAATMYQVEHNIETVGEALSCKCSLDLAGILHKCAEASPDIEISQLEDNTPGGSEDATYFMNEVQKNGGKATYCVFGTELAAGHHNEKFDIKEDTLLPAVNILFQSVKVIMEQ